jgi:plastocyanin
MRAQPVVHRADPTIGSFPPVLVALSSGHKLGLGLAGVIFIVFALTASFVAPRYRPDFPGPDRRGVRGFIAVTFVVFLGMLAAVEIFGAESEEKAGAETKKEAGPAAKAVSVTETEFKIALPQTTLAPGSYSFDLKNAGKISHNLTVQGPGVDNAATPTIGGGKSSKLRVALESGQYDLYCSVPGHKQAGMDVKIKVG